VDSIGTLSYFLVGSLLESMWSLCGLHRDFVVFFSREFTGVHRDFVIFFSREFTGVHVESMWTPQVLCSIFQ